MRLTDISPSTTSSPRELVHADLTRDKQAGKGRTGEPNAATEEYVQFVAGLVAAPQLANGALEPACVWGIARCLLCP